MNDTTQHNCSLNKNRSHKRLRYIKELFTVEWFVAVERLSNIKLERLLTRIRSCTTLFCCMKNKFQEKSPPLLGRI